MTVKNIPPVDAFKQLNVAPGEVIFLEGQPAQEAYVILRGEVQVTVHDKSNNIIVINRMSAGEMFGEIAVINENTTRTATTISEKGCDLLVIDKSVFDQHLNSADPLLRFIIDHLCRRIIRLTELARAQAPQDAP